MKKLILIAFIGAFVASFALKSQTTNSQSYKFVFTDTLKKTTDSIKYFLVPVVLYDHYDYTVNLVADSLKGATDATANLQLSITKPAGGSFTNITGTTFTIDGVKSEKILTGTIQAGANAGAMLRIKWVKGTGWTQQTKIRAAVILTPSTIYKFSLADTLNKWLPKTGKAATATKADNSTLWAGKDTTWGKNIYYQTKAVGTAYSLTGTSALLTFGTTSPTDTIKEAATYSLNATVKLDFVTARITTRDTIIIKVKRINNTALVLARPLLYAPADTLNCTWGIFPLSNIIYTTSRTNDIIQVHGYYKHALTYGTIKATEAKITALKLYK